VDSQVHLWKANTPDRPWTPGATPQRPSRSIERLFPMMAEAGVDRVVIVRSTRAHGSLCAGRRSTLPGTSIMDIALDDPPARAASQPETKPGVAASSQ
jgi:hypothetical protein